MSRFLVVIEDDEPRPVSVELKISANYDTRGNRQLTASRSMLQRFNPKQVGFGIVDAMPQDYFESSQVEE